MIECMCQGNEWVQVVREGMIVLFILILCFGWYKLVKN
jgi:hypothetical protein